MSSDTNMKTFAAVNKKNNLIEEIVIADNKVVIEILLPDFFIYEETENTGKAYINGEFYKNKFIPPRPYKSWKFNLNTNSWNPPKQYPQDGKIYEWIEKEKKWSMIKYDWN